MTVPNGRRDDIAKPRSRHHRTYQYVWAQIRTSCGYSQQELSENGRTRHFL